LKAPVPGIGGEIKIKEPSSVPVIAKPLKNWQVSVQGYFTLFKALRTMVIYIPGTGYLTYLIAIAFNFCKTVCVNRSSSSRKQYVKFSVKFFSLPFWALCVGCL
jgi:hypothetical protein